MKIFTTLAAALGLMFLVSAPLSASEAPAVAPSYGLTDGAGRLMNNNRFVCSVFKVAPKTFMTAKHCTTNVSSEYKIEYGIETAYVRSIVTPVLEKQNRKNKDWSILNTATDIDKAKTFLLGCDVDIVLGMQVGTVGFPAKSELTVGYGYVSSVKPVNISQANADFTIDIPAAGGASGSVVFLQHSYEVIGILIEAYYGQQGVYAVGVESIKNTDLCLTKDIEFST